MRNVQGVIKVDNEGNTLIEDQSLGNRPIFITQQDLLAAEKGDTVIVQVYPNHFGKFHINFIGTGV